MSPDFIFLRIMENGASEVKPGALKALVGGEVWSRGESWWL